MVKNNQDNDFNDNKLTKLDSVTVNRNPTLHNELANKKYINDELDENTIFRFNYLKISVGNDIYNLTKYDKIQLTETTNIKDPNSGGYSLQNWVIKCNDKRMLVKHKTFYDQEKQTLQQETVEQQAYLQSVTALFI